MITNGRDEDSKKAGIRLARLFTIINQAAVEGRERADADAAAAAISIGNSYPRGL